MQFVRWAWILLIGWWVWLICAVITFVTLPIPVIGAVVPSLSTWIGETMLDPFG